MGISFSAHQSDRDYPFPDDPGLPDFDAPRAGFDGDFGNTWFPRSYFGSRTGGIVRGWPAKGGYYTHCSSVAELDFLGLDRFKATIRSEDIQEEEAHCARMRQLGARWCLNPYKEPNGAEKPQLYVGWPADGGVWAIQATKGESARKGLGRINNAFTMEERWQMIKELGGAFYPQPKDCPYLDLDDSE